MVDIKAGCWEWHSIPPQMAMSDMPILIFQAAWFSAMMEEPHCISTKVAEVS